MISSLPTRRAPAYALCAVCRARLADRTPRVMLTIDAEPGAAAISRLVHARCQARVEEFTRVMGYTPADLSEVVA